MGVPAAIRDRFASDEGHCNALQRYIAPTLRAFCDTQHYELIGPRVKDLESLSDKLETGRYKNWAAINDLVAAAIVVPTASHEQAVLDHLCLHFEEVAVVGRRSRPMAPDQFRFDLTRWYGRVRVDEGTPAEFLRLAHLTFEVQIRTYFEHAWSVVTHELTYKAHRTDWRRLRLAAQLKAMVEQIEQTIAGVEGVAAATAEAAWPETEAQRIIEGLLQDLLDEVHLEELAPRSWSRASESVVRLVHAARPGNAADPLNEAIAFVRTFCDSVKSGEFTLALSGSLLQALYAFSVVRGWDVTEFPVVDSEELRVMYRIGVATAIDMT